MSNYNQFSILEVIPKAATKEIIIRTNFKVDPNSVTLKTVSYYNYDAARLETYKLSVEGKDIRIVLNDYPANDSRYYLKVLGIKDALGRKLTSQYDDYIKFVNDVKTKVEIISPVSRETLKDRTVEVRLSLKEIMEDVQLKYRIEISADNAFFGKVTSIVCTVPNQYLNKSNIQFVLVDDEILTTDTGLPISFNNVQFQNDELSLNTYIEKEGQLYIRARAEINEATVGVWSETVSFNILTVSMDSLETTFLEDYLTTDELFDDSVMEAIEIVDRSDIATTDSMFFIEFNKEIVLPENYKVTQDGLIKLGVVIAKRKEMK